ncbi:MAG: phosphoheptose isomerase [Bergeyella sp.]|nr:phosphoheptose isomerase [Bergeyella sp.]
MNKEKTEIFVRIAKILDSHGFIVVTKDDTRPWGGFFVIEEGQAQDFANHYFDGVDIENLKIGGKLSPKILLVAPKARLSWQYHRRRAEVWRVVEGKVGIKKSDTDEEGELEIYFPKDRITLQQGERHRLIGLDHWGIVAEIWQHTDPTHPSDEEDIVRIQDDFGR